MTHNVKMMRLKRLARGAAAGLAVALSAPLQALAQAPSPLQPASPNAARTAQLFWVTFGIAAVVFVVVEVLLIYAVVRYRRKFPDDMPKYKRPYSMCGTCTRELDTIGRGRGFFWSVQNGVMEVIPSDGYIGGIVLITPETGMIDTPTITDNGVKVSCLLNPEIRPNRRVRIESGVLEMNAEGGEYRVSQCAFTGDNRDGDFKVTIHGEAVKGGKVDIGKKT